MSRVWTWRQAIFESDLQATTKLVLQALASHLNDMGGPMFPSQERLAKLCSLSERSVITHLQIAEDAGWIVATKRQLDGSKWAANEYGARFPDGVKQVHPTKQDGVKDVHLRGEGVSPGGVKEVHTNSPSELSNEHSPHTPKGAGVSDDDLDFRKVVEAYTQVCPSRVDRQRAWAVWNELGLKASTEQILGALPSFTGLDQWKKDGGRYIPNLSKWLSDGAWRAQGSVSLQSKRDELLEREKIITKGMQAFARLESDRKLDLPHAPEDLAAYEAWQKILKGGA